MFAIEMSHDLLCETRIANLFNEFDYACSDLMGVMGNTFRKAHRVEEDLCDLTIALVAGYSPQASRVHRRYYTADIP
jgi:hypothetical protein